jgi:sulfur-carrier protein adenylyltransferase/sulfurtransferase
MSDVLSDTFEARYSRHICLADIGEAGQQKLLNARVLLVGCGGLGSPAALYLAAAGVGTLGLVDDDVVSLSNLQRQILFATDEVEQPKVIMAKQRLAALNPTINIIPHQMQLASDNALRLMEDYDVIVDGSDNFATRYLVNDACVSLGKPCVYGAVMQFQGQVSVFHGPMHACYRCVFPEMPPAHCVPNCSEAGVVGALPGMIGTMQALETIKLICGIGEPLVGRLLLIDSLSMQFKTVATQADPQCPMCSGQYNFDNVPREARICEIDVPTITPADFAKLREDNIPHCLLDVREPAEYEAQNIGGQLRPLATLKDNLQDLDPSALTIVHCRSGKRSAQAVAILQEAGFANVFSLAGGIEALQ